MKTYTYFVKIGAGFTEKEILGVITAEGILEADKLFEEKTGKNPCKGSIQCSPQTIPAHEHN